MGRFVDKCRLSTDKVERARRVLLLTPNELADIAKVSPTTISKIRNGRMSVSIPLARRIAKALRVPLNSLIERFEETPVTNAPVSQVG